MRHRLLLVCLILSGFAGLAYELLWTRLLSFSFGSTTLSFSTVLAVFFGGLAFGAYLAGRRAASVARPIRAYALIEIATGVFGLLLHPLLSHMSGFFTAIDPGPGLLGGLVRFAVSAPILLVPTLLMGATLPIICAAIIERDDEVGSGTALIYGVNTFGACLGAYLVTYHLLPSLGVFGSNLVAVVANLAAGGAALLIESRAQLDARGESGPKGREPRPPRPGEGKLVVVTGVLTGLSGFAAIALQLVWVRLFATFMSGTIYAVGAVLISVLIGIATGSLIIARELRRSRHPVFWLVGLQVATIISVVLFARYATWVSFQLQAMRVPGGGLGNLHAQLVATFLVLAIPTMCSGASFPLLVHLVENRAENTGRAVGSLYAANTVGSILGSLVGGFLILPEAGSEAAMFIALIALAGVGALAAMLLPSEVPRPARLLLAGATLGAPMAYNGFDVRQLALSFPGEAKNMEQYENTQKGRLKTIQYFAEGKHATVVVTGSEASRSLTLSGLGQGTRNFAPPHHLIESLLVGLVPLAHAKDTKSALVVGLGAGQTVEVLTDLGVDKVKVVELEERVVDAVKVIFEPKDLFDPQRVEVALNDARHELLLDKARGQRRYDLITSMPAHPWVAASIFTEEFFELARDSLAPGGVFCTWFGVSWMDSTSVESLFRAFAKVFPHYAAYWVEEAWAYYLVGSVDPLHLDLDRLNTLAQHPLLDDRREITGRYYLASRLYASGTPDTPQPPEGVVNSDDSAFVETQAPRSSTRSAVLEDFMPVEYLHPSLVDEPMRPEFYDGLLETLLATPGGQIAHESVRLRAKRAKRTLDGVRALLSPEAQRYFEGRVALAEGRGGQARAILSEVAALPSPFSERAAKFAALAHPKDSPAQLEALAALPPSTDVALRLLAVDRARGLARARPGPVDPAGDPIGWLLATARDGEVRDPASARSILRAQVGPAIRRSTNSGVFAVCAELATRLGLVEEATNCQDERRRLEVNRGKELIGRGRQAGASGRFQDAAAFLEEADRLTPGDPTVMTLLLRAYVETGNEAGLAQVKERLRFHGHPSDWIDYMFAQARARKLGQGTGDEAGEVTPTP